MNRDTKRLALQRAQAWGQTHGAKDMYIGYRQRGGVRTNETCVVFTVPKKVSRAFLPQDDVIPPTFMGVNTDVREAVYFSGNPTTQELDQRLRPCPAGFSVGHKDITAGTFGAAVKTQGDDWLALTNNHVGANSNDARIGDAWLQPGPHDGGTMPADLWARLEAFVEINFQDALPGKKNNTIARAWWGFIKALGNSGAKLARCPYRVRVGRENIQQDMPNTVDAAIGRVLGPEMLTPVVAPWGMIAGISDAPLGTRVRKAGRTTEHTFGTVTGVEASVSVNYSSIPGQKLAPFAHQIIIEGDGGDFSAGGDSGSIILNDDNYAVGLLFAGGGGQTIANPISEVVRLLGVRFV